MSVIVITSGTRTERSTDKHIIVQSLLVASPNCDVTGVRVGYM